MRGLSAPAYTVPVSESTAARGDLTRLLGAAPVAVVAVDAPPPESSRFHLVGVMAPKGAQAAEAGIALIAVDGKPARAFRVGSSLDTGLMLRSVAQRTASIGHGSSGSAFTLELPVRPPPATGVLQAVTMDSPMPDGNVPPQGRSSPGAYIGQPMPQAPAPFDPAQSMQPGNQPYQDAPPQMMDPNGNAQPMR